MISYDPCQLHAIIGLPRRGKTALGVLLARSAYLSGALIYSNIKLFDTDGKDWRAPDGRLDSEDPRKCLEQVMDLCGRISAEGSFNVPRFLFLSEFKMLCDSHSWKELQWTDVIWSQLGKLGITAVVDEQNFKRIYDGYRIICAYKYVVVDHFQRKKYRLPDVGVIVAVQDANDYDVYNVLTKNKKGLPSPKTVDLSEAYPLYDTHQFLYFKKRLRA